MILFYMITPTKATTLAATTPSGRNIDMLRFLPIALGDAGYFPFYKLLILMVLKADMFKIRVKNF